MKNIHLIPTDKPSRLFYNKKDSIFTIDNDFENVIEEDWFQDYNIYITSDKEIKEGDWFFKDGIIGKCDKYPDIINGYNVKKIILTDNQDLIKDGIQEIDDDFLEWFVKNPSCEEVEVNQEFNTKNMVYGINTNPYKIIIPKEPKLINNCPKCGLDLIIREHCTPICTDIDCRGIILSNETLREWASKKEPKQETLEEAAENYSKITLNKGGLISDKQVNGFIAGAKWQSERMHSKAIEFAEWIRIKDFQTTERGNWIGLELRYYTTEELFEQFKKK